MPSTIPQLYRSSSAEVAPNTAGEINSNFQVDELAAAILGIKSGGRAESKTFPYQTDPWNIVGTGGVLLWTLSNIRTTYIRATDNQTGAQVSYVTLIFVGKSYGWFVASGAALHLPSWL